MRRAFCAFAFAMFVTGCIEDEQQVKQGPSLEEQQRAAVQAELDKIRAQADRSIQKSIETGQIQAEANRSLQKSIKTSQDGVERAKPRFAR